jgi:hypothetical protein
MKTILPFQKYFFIGFVFLCSFSLLFSAVPAFAVDTQTISAYPTHASDADPRTKSWFIYSIPAGVQRNDSVTVVNNGTEPITLKVYPVDSLTANNGSFALANDNAPKSDVGAWITMSTSEVTLGPKEVRNIPFTIAIPANATEAEHSGGIIIQETKAKKLTNKGLNINVISRIGVRIYETVPGAEQLNMDVRNLQYSVINNHLTFTFTAENKGTVYVSPTGMLEVKDMFGRIIDRISLNPLLGTIVPGKPVTVTVPTQVLSPVLGWDTANVALYYSPTKAAVASILFMPNPWSAFILVFVILLIVSFFVSRKYLVRFKGKNHKMVLAPHVWIIVIGILFGTIIFSSLASYILSYFFLMK